MSEKRARLLVTTVIGEELEGNWSDEPMTDEEIKAGREFFERLFRESDKGFITLDIGERKVTLNLRHVVSVEMEVA